MAKRGDMRKVAEKRMHIFTLKLSEQEAAGLRRLAERHFRRPGDELRHLLNEAITRDKDVS